LSLPLPRGRVIVTPSPTGKAPAVPLSPGDPAPLFIAPSPSNPRYVLAAAAGRWLALAFLPPEESPESVAALTAVAARRSLFDDDNRAFFGVLSDPAAIAGAKDQVPGLRWFLDPRRELSALYGIEAGGWVVLDPTLRVIRTAPLSESAAVVDFLAALPAPADHAGVPMHAPALIVPRVFEPEVCRRLIDLYQAHGGEASGFMREIDGKTRLIRDDGHKRRSDAPVDDEALREAARERILRRLAPEIAKAFQFRATRIERYIVACYDANSGGWFRPHRDNTTRGTAHRKFAVSINLNAEDYDGGDLRFPEYGSRTYRAPTGGAVVFSCSLLHEATPVTRGRRFAFLPFLYDEDGARLREANAGFLEGSGSDYRAAAENA